MRHTPAILLALAAIFAVVGIVQHARSRQLRTEFERDRLRLFADTQRAQAGRDETIRQLEAERTRGMKAAAQPKAMAPGQPADVPAASATSARMSAAPAVPDPELRRLRVLTFVSEQRMQFAPLLHRLGFTATQRQAFDHIQEEYYAAVLDGKLDESGRQQARDARGAALRELFGPGHDAWLEANQQQSARAVVDQIIHLTFPSSGALNAAQADELTRIVAEHRLTPSAAGGPASYDWDRIISDARTILADRQMEDFTAAVVFRRASDQTSAMAAQVKSAGKRPNK